MRPSGIPRYSPNLICVSLHSVQWLPFERITGKESLLPPGSKAIQPVTTKLLKQACTLFKHLWGKPCKVNNRITLLCDFGLRLLEAECVGEKRIWFELNALYYCWQTVLSGSVQSNVVTWLILPVVICLSQRLSHACLSINDYTVKLRMAHYISYNLFDSTLLLG